jgi:hypothetical protein
MVFIIVFTIFCEKSLARTKNWLNYYNPLLQPIVDKVVSELMILGATAFGLTVVNEMHELTHYDWYTTLHWIDTTIFIFALIYVMCTIHVLGLMNRVMHKMAIVDAIPAGDLIRSADERNYEKIADQFIETVRDELIVLKSEASGSKALPKSVMNTEQLSSVLDGGTGGESEQAEMQVRSFLTSEDTTVEIEVTSRYFHDLAYRMVHHLVAMKVLTHIRSVTDDGEISSVTLRKNPRSKWHLKTPTVKSMRDMGADAKSSLEGVERNWTAKRKKLGGNLSIQVLLSYRYHLCTHTVLILYSYCTHTVLIL